MSQAVTSDSNMLNILKTWYTDEKLENLLFRNSPVARKVRKIKIGGKTYNFSALYGRGGAVSGDYTVARSNASTTSRNAEFAVPPGKIFSVFNFNQLEMMASTNPKGAYVQAAIDKMFAGTEAMRKTFAATLYGYGYGELGVIGTPVAQNASTMTVDTSTLVKLDVGTKFEVTTTVLPSGALAAGGPYTVTAIDGQTVTFSPVCAPVAGFIAGAWIELSGGRDGSGNPNMPTGLAAWVPYLADRTGGSWTTYIGTSFYGVTRSTNVERLAGNYIKRVKASESYHEAILRGVAAVRRAGGVPDMIILNDEDYGVVIGEIQADTTYFQSQNMPGKGTENEFQAGLSSMGFQFSTNWVKYVYDDPYCPNGYAWILDSSVFDFVGLSNVNTPINDGVSDNNPGSQSVSDIGMPDTQFKFLIDDYLNVVPGTPTSDGPAAEVSLSLYGNFVVRNPAHCCAIFFDP